MEGKIPSSKGDLQGEKRKAGSFTSREQNKKKNDPRKEPIQRSVTATTKTQERRGNEMMGKPSNEEEERGNWNLIAR
jgi:hypothetical protein